LERDGGAIGTPNRIDPKRIKTHFPYTGLLPHEFGVFVRSAKTLVQAIPKELAKDVQIRIS
jgi:hypothetical protein